MTKQIPLSQGKVALVDDSDFERVNQYKWFVAHTRTYYYAARHSSGVPTRKLEFMHRFILNAPAEFMVDHRDGNGLNNTRQNLRIATVAQNGYNRKVSKNSTSGFKGVTWVGQHHRWRATIKVDGKRIYLGEFRNPHDAARAYDVAARAFFGEFALLNLPS